MLRRQGQVRRTRFWAALAAVLAVVTYLFVLACTALYCASASTPSSRGANDLNSAAAAAVQLGISWSGLQQPARRSNPRIILRYMACMGGFNQLYSHVAALTLAAALGADVVLPPALARDSYDRRVDPMHPERETVKWHAAAAESLLDVARIAHTWRQLGLEVQSVSRRHAAWVFACRAGAQSVKASDTFLPCTLYRHGVQQPCCRALLCCSGAAHSTSGWPPLPARHPPTLHPEPRFPLFCNAALQPPQLDVLPGDLRRGFLKYTEPAFQPHQVVWSPLHCRFTMCQQPKVMACIVRRQHKQTFAATSSRAHAARSGNHVMIWLLLSSQGSKSLHVA